MTEDNLSQKLFTQKDGKKFAYADEIRKSIKKLKEEVKRSGNLHTECCNKCEKIFRTDRHENIINEKINKIFGKELAGDL